MLVQFVTECNWQQSTQSRWDRVQGQKGYRMEYKDYSSFLHITQLFSHFAVYCIWHLRVISVNLQLYKICFISSCFYSKYLMIIIQEVVRLLALFFSMAPGIPINFSSFLVLSDRINSTYRTLKGSSGGVVIFFLFDWLHYSNWLGYAQSNPSFKFTRQILTASRGEPENACMHGCHVVQLS